MKKERAKVLAIAIISALTVGCLQPVSASAAKKAKPKLSKSKVSVKAGSKKKITVKNGKKAKVKKKRKSPA